MNYQELIDEVSAEAHISKREARKMLRALADVIQRNLIAGHEVNIRKVGRLQRGVTAPRGKPLNGSKPRPANVIFFKSTRSFLNKMRKS